MTIKPFIPLILASMLTAGCQSSTSEKTSAMTAHDSTTTQQLPQTSYFAIETPYGRMVVRLYDETPVHRDNFKKLASTGFYDGTTFHRVIEGFMIQGGDPNSKDDDPSNDGVGGPGYTLPAEIKPQFFHKRGALAAARQGDQVNPERRSSGSQFYIVHGRTFTDEELNQLEERMRAYLGDPSFSFSPEAREAYKTIGGAPHLDGQYTIFGEVVEGWEVLDQIARLDTPRKRQQPAPPSLMDHPYEPVPIKVYPLPQYVPSNS